MFRISYRSNNKRKEKYKENEEERETESTIVLSFKLIIVRYTNSPILVLLMWFTDSNARVGCRAQMLLGR